MARKRSNGEGTVYVRKDGTYCAQETIDKKRITAYGKNKTEALAKLKKKIKDKMTAGEVISSNKDITVAQYLPYYVSGIPLTNKSTKENYGSIQRRIASLTGELKLSKVTNSTLNSFAVNMKSLEYADSTIHSTVKFYMRALKQAQREGYISQNINLDYIAHRKQKPYILPKVNDVIKSLKEIRPIGMRYLGLFCLYTGLRRGELIGLKWKDIDEEKGIITVKRNYTCEVSSHRLYIKSPKNGLAGQIVQIPDDGMKLLTFLKEEYKKANIHSEFVFCDKNGRHLRPDSVTATLHRAMLRVSPKGSVHILRHLHATILAKEGVPLRTISKQLRHSSIVTTSIYINAMENEVYDEIKGVSLPGCSSVAVDHKEK
jgi:integrase